MSPSAGAAGSPPTLIPPILQKASPISLNRIADVEESQSPIETPIAAHITNRLVVRPPVVDSKEQPEQADLRLANPTSDFGRYDLPEEMRLRTGASIRVKESDENRAEQIASSLAGVKPQEWVEEYAPQSLLLRDLNPRIPLRTISQATRSSEYERQSADKYNPAVAVESRDEISQLQAPNMVWRKDASPVKEAEPELRSSDYRAWSSPQRVLPILESPTSPVVQPPAIAQPSMVRRGGDINISEIAEKVSRIITRQLTIERERRGGRGWR
jgi:hypothetical protein